MASISVAPSRWLLLLAVVLCSLLLLFTQANEEINHAVVQLEQVDKLLTPMVALDKDQSLASFLSAQSVPLDFDLHPAAIATEGISEGNQLTEAIELEDEALFVEPTMEPSQEVTDGK